jgi:hypothetical protein
LPACITPDGRVLLDSWDIAALSGLEAPDPTFKKLLDEELGPLVRHLSYYYLFKPSNYNVWEGICLEGSHWFWRVCWYLGLSKVATAMMQAVFQPSDEEKVKECREKLFDVIDKIDKEILLPRGCNIKAGRNGSKFIHGAMFGTSGMPIFILFYALLFDFI